MGLVLFEDIFVTRDIDKDGKIFERVSRLFCESESFGMDIILDIYIDMCPIKLGDKFRLLLSTTMDDNDFADDGEYDPSQAQSMRSSNFDYIMCGKVYRIEMNFEQNLGNRLVAYVSYGGLLLKLQGDASNLQNFKNDMTVYLFLKKLSF
ncbi:RNA polymerases I, II, and III subunit ABC3 [Intoshia linei]|uniref:DNA-directed RNA polymerases I, II, and III subunit RPABC3 n=1 Tax=Intoshia linei TaxID=1819745 RepID=A0A177B2C8_9BILA|nr:RNA polymerases I, II, and III subunit ABC3 [Intoshia linei]